MVKFFGENQMINISNLTLEEQERIAYIEGNLEVAKLLGKIMDVQAELVTYEEEVWWND
jgi:hypothetical protein